MNRKSTAARRMGAIIAAASLMALPGAQAHLGEEHPAPPPPPQCDEFITGGGWIIGANGEKLNFGIKAGISGGVAYGQFNAVDHGAKMHVKGANADVYYTLDPTTRLLRFQVEGTANEARVILSDNGEPGRNDTFELQLLQNGTLVYQASGKLGEGNGGGGNIQLHGCK